MSTDADDEPADESARKPLDVLGEIADASFDIFVMPGEYANSRYNLPQPDVSETASAPETASTTADDVRSRKATFSWGGSAEEQEVLRLPTGVKAAERLSPSVTRPRGLWFEVEGRDIKGDVEMLSRTWDRLWAVVIVITVLVNGWSGLRDLDSQKQSEVMEDHV